MTVMDDDQVGSKGTAYRPRGYQLEMLEASRQQNVIVAVCWSSVIVDGSN